MNIKNSTYDLISIVNHEGEPNFGHCYSYILDTGLWFEANDEVVTYVKKINTSNNYLLFYRSR